MFVADLVLQVLKKKKDENEKGLGVFIT